MTLKFLMQWCSHIIKSTSFKDNEGNTYNIQGSINCKTVGVIYCILCTECENNIYVGQTGDEFYQPLDRFPNVAAFLSGSLLHLSFFCPKGFLSFSVNFV
jgi:hypothetical protein